MRPAGKTTPGQRKADVRITVSADLVEAAIDRPDTGNAINDDVVAGLASAVALAAENRARALVISGTGGTFSTGVDPAELALMRSDPARAVMFLERVGEVFDRLETAPFATVAVVEGQAVAVGCELLLACDIAIASTTARIRATHAGSGHTPAAGGSVRLCRHLSKARARYLLLSGESLTGSEAERWGLVTLATEPDRLRNVAAAVVARLTDLGDLTTVKRLITNADRLSPEQALHLERAVFRA